MHVLIVATNRERHPFPVAPLGALFVAQAARNAGHRVDLLDLGTCRLPEYSLKRAIARLRPDAIAFSIRNHDNCYFIAPHGCLEETRRLADAARKAAPTLPLILGGSGFSICPRRWMRELDADYGIVGEGEAAFATLLAQLDSGVAPIASAGVLTRDAKDDALNCRPAPRPQAIGSPSHRDCQYRRYLSAGGFISVQSKRGCPFGCIYCVYPRLEGNQFRARAAEAVADEIESASDQGRYFYFADGVFNAPAEHAQTVCEQLAIRAERMPEQKRPRWMALCNPGGFDGAMARAMKRAGCIGIEFGLDAATEKMLRNLGKPFGVDEIATALGAAGTAGLPFAIHLLFGGPGETIDDMRATRDFLDRCAPARGIFASIGLRIHPGTPLESIARNEGRIAANDDLFEPAFYVSETLGARPQDEVDRLARAREEWTSPLDWEKPMMRLIQSIVNRSGQRPQWLNVRNYGRHMRRAKKEQ